VERTFRFTAYLRQREDESNLEVVLYDKMKRKGVYLIIELNIINTVCGDGRIEGCSPQARRPRQEGSTRC
jgi:hypothetical protein